MEFVVIEKRDNDRFVIYDIENKGSCCCSKYTMKQIIDAGHTIYGVRYNGENIGVNDIVPLLKNGQPRQRMEHYSLVPDTKRSAVTILQGLTPSREEKRAMRETMQKRDATIKDNKKQAKLAELEREKRIKEEEKQRKALQKEMEVNIKHRQVTKVSAYLVDIRMVASEYNLESRQYTYILECTTPTALTNLRKLSKELSKRGNGFYIDSNASDMVERHGKYSVRATFSNMLEDVEGIQIFAGAEVRLDFTNVYEDYNIWATFRAINHFMASCDGRHIDVNIETPFGPTAYRDYTIRGIAQKLRQMGRPKI